MVNRNIMSMMKIKKSSIVRTLRGGGKEINYKCSLNSIQKKEKVLYLVEMCGNPL